MSRFYQVSCSRVFVLTLFVAMISPFGSSEDTVTVSGPLLIDGAEEIVIASPVNIETEGDIDVSNGGSLAFVVGPSGKITLAPGFEAVGEEGGTFPAFEAYIQSDSTLLNNLVAGTHPKWKDTDLDGMSDWWEIGYGLNFNDASDAAGDVDNDGVSNLQEYELGSNPLDSINGTNLVLLRLVFPDITTHAVNTSNFLIQ